MISFINKTFFSCCVMTVIVFFTSVTANAMDDFKEDKEKEKPVTTVAIRRDLCQIPLEERRVPTQTLTFRGVQLRVSNEDMQHVIEFLQDPSLTPQRLGCALSAFARRYGFSQQVMSEVIIGPLLDHICPRISFPLSIQTQRRAIYPAQHSEEFSAVDARQPRYLKIVCSLIPYFPFEITVPEPRSSRLLTDSAGEEREEAPSHTGRWSRRDLKIVCSLIPLIPSFLFEVTIPEPRSSRLLTDSAGEEREEAPSHTRRWSQRAFDWPYTISEYIENHPYGTMLWLMVLSFLVNLSRH